MDEKIVCATTDSIEVLNLSIRVHNALKRSKIWDIGELIVLNDDQLLAVRNLGEKGIAEIKKRLSSVELLDQPPTLRENEAQKEWSGEPQILIDLGPPMVPRYEVVENLQFMLANQTKSGTLHSQLEINGRRLEEIISAHRSSTGLYEQLLKVLIAPVTVSQELERLLQGLSPREIDILIRRLGYKRQTLEAVAFVLGVTRERVRQLQIQGTNRLLSASKTLPLARIRSAILFADDMDMSFDDWAQRLLRSGLLGVWNSERFADFNQVEQLIIVCCLLENQDEAFVIPESLKHMIRLHGKGMSAVPARMLTLLECFTGDVERLVKRHLRYSGAVSLDWLINQDSVDFRRSDLGLILETEGYFALNENWYMSFEYTPDNLEKGSVLHRSLLKMFQFCGPLGIRDLYYGIEHTLIKTDFPRPSISVLNEILLRYGYDCEEGLWHWDGISNEELNRGEKIIMRTLDDNDGVAHHSQLAVAFINSSMSFALLHSTLRRSPLFDNFEHSIYKLRGATPNLASIQKARDSGIETPLDLEYYFDMEGNIVVHANLGTLAVGHGTIASAKFPNLLGNWDLLGFLGDAGEVEVTENEIRGLRRIIKLLGCAVGDRIKMTFDTDTRQVSVSLIEETE